MYHFPEEKCMSPNHGLLAATGEAYRHNNIFPVNSGHLATGCKPRGGKCRLRGTKHGKRCHKQCLDTQKKTLRNERTYVHNTEDMAWLTGARCMAILNLCRHTRLHIPGEQRTDALNTQAMAVLSGGRIRRSGLWLPASLPQTLRTWQVSW